MGSKNLHLHEKRKIRFVELGALLGVREMLRTGVLAFDGEKECEASVHKFHMGTSGEQYSCGTVGCIGGNMAMLMGIKPHNYGTYVDERYARDNLVDYNGNMIRSPSLAPLFYPPLGLNWDKIGPKQAIKAIDNWLKTGKPKWNAVLGKRAVKGSGE